MSRTVYFVSDGTGVTAETLGRSLLTQFDTKHFDHFTVPYVKSIERAQELLIKINAAKQKDGVHPVVFMTLVDKEIGNVIKSSDALVIDFFQTFIKSLESEFGAASSKTVGKFHSIGNYNNYKTRIDAINYVLACDDGVNTKDYEYADIILIGVSRSGKTPTCLYLALQFGIFAANYPLTEEDLGTAELPKDLIKHQKKLFGLIISPERLQQIRQERLPNSRYCSHEQCQLEIELINRILNKKQIPHLDSTLRSVEELAADILARTGIKRKL